MSCVICGKPRARLHRNRPLIDCIRRPSHKLHKGCQERTAHLNSNQFESLVRNLRVKGVRARYLAYK